MCLWLHILDWWRRIQEQMWAKTLCKKRAAEPVCFPGVKLLFTFFSPHISGWIRFDMIPVTHRTICMRSFCFRCSSSSRSLHAYTHAHCASVDRCPFPLIRHPFDIFAVCVVENVGESCKVPWFTWRNRNIIIPRYATYTCCSTDNRRSKQTTTNKNVKRYSFCLSASLSRARAHAQERTSAPCTTDSINQLNSCLVY